MTLFRIPSESDLSALTSCNFEIECCTIVLFDFCEFQEERAADVTQTAGKTHYRRFGREHSYSTVVPNSQSEAFFT
jgi:hypothetical protein